MKNVLTYRNGDMFRAMERVNQLNMMWMRDASASFAETTAKATNQDVRSIFVKRLERIGDPHQYVNFDYEQLIVQNDAG